MALQRSVHQRLTEAVHALLKADVELAALCASGDPLKPKINLGRYTESDSYIQAPQIDVYPILSAEWRPGVSGVSDVEYDVMIAYYEQYTESDPVTPGVNETGINVIHRIEALLFKGSDGKYHGRLNDPDDPTKKINEELKKFQRSLPAFTPNRAALIYITVGTFSCKEDRDRLLTA